MIPSFGILAYFQISIYRREDSLTCNSDSRGRDGFNRQAPFGPLHPDVPFRALSNGSVFARRHTDCHILASKQRRNVAVVDALDILSGTELRAQRRQHQGQGQRAVD
jgi:hypothetical protein